MRFVLVSATMVLLSACPPAPAKAPDPDQPTQSEAEAIASTIDTFFATDPNKLDRAQTAYVELGKEVPPASGGWRYFDCKDEIGKPIILNRHVTVLDAFTIVRTQIIPARYFSTRSSDLGLAFLMESLTTDVIRRTTRDGAWELVYESETSRRNESKAASEACHTPTPSLEELSPRSYK